MFSLEKQNAKLSSVNPRLAIVSAGRALERKGIVCSFRSDGSQWAVLKWAIVKRA